MTWIAIKFQLHALDSTVAVFYRFAAACLALFAFSWIKKSNLSFKKNDHLLFLGQGFFMFSLNFLLAYWASEMAPSALVALAFTALIYFNMLFGRLFLGLPLEQKVIYGAVASLLGMFFISYNELIQLKEHPGFFVGFLISLAGTVSASLGNIFSTRSRQLKIPIVSNNAWSMLYGSVLTLIYCLLKVKNFSVAVDTSFLISFIYLVLFGTIISFGAYLKVIDLLGPSKAAFTSVISPIIAIVVSIFAEKLNFNGYMLVGVLLCLLGNLIALMKKSWFRGWLTHAH